ncbi:MAG: M15 family metallopeptidase [Saprospiraceae bacterium]
MKNFFQFLLLLSFASLQFWACKVDNGKALENLENTMVLVDEDTAVNNKTSNSPYQSPKGWSELSIENGFIIDIKYATADNFTKKQIYDCSKCLLRTDVAEALQLLQAHLKTNFNLNIKMFDCYRPAPYQQRLWDAVPNASYVTPPSKGSMHSRGMAVDLTLVDSLGNELDMGTEYDYFGKEAHIDHKDLPEQVLANRQFLQEKMAAYGFEGIRTEWWHFAFTKRYFNLEKFVWPCDNT